MISVVINTLNEEKNLPKALNSVKDFADEIVVVDMHSDDGTKKIAENFGAEVYEHERMGYVEPARNYAIGKATKEWVLIIDADETIPNLLKSKLKAISRDVKSSDYYRLPRKNIIFGKWVKHSRWWPDYNIRFFKRGSVSWNEIIHSIPVTHGKGADLESIEDNAIIHHTYMTIDQYVDRLNRYTTHQVPVIIKSGYKFSWVDLLKEPTGEFLSRYFQGEGYKDGIHGLALSLLQAFSELVLYLKVWQHEKFEEKSISLTKVTEEIKDRQRDMNYWISDSLIKERGGIILKIKRKLRLF